jgi:excinuclease UvrABC ATPase subunit
MTVREAILFFKDTSKLVSRLARSGRPRLSKARPVGNYIKRRRGTANKARGALQKTQSKTLFIFDEPTGLHFDDINKLLAAFGL